MLQKRHHSLSVLSSSGWFVLHARLNAPSVYLNVHTLQGFFWETQEKFKNFSHAWGRKRINFPREKMKRAPLKSYRNFFAPCASFLMYFNALNSAFPPRGTPALRYLVAVFKSLILSRLWQESVCRNMVVSVSVYLVGGGLLCQAKNSSDLCWKKRRGPLAVWLMVSYIWWLSCSVRRAMTFLFQIRTQCRVV